MKCVTTAVILFLLAGHPAESAQPAEPEDDDEGGPESGDGEDQELEDSTAEELWISHASHWYKWFSEPKNLFDAEGECQKYGAYLAVGSSKGERDFLKTQDYKSLDCRVQYHMRSHHCHKSAYWCERETAVPTKLECDNTYQVRRDRYKGPERYWIDHRHNLGKNSDLTKCQALCNKNEKCRSLTYEVNFAGWQYCYLFTVRLKDLLDTEREGYIERHLNDKNINPTVTSYDRDCTRVPTVQGLSTTSPNLKNYRVVPP